MNNLLNNLTTANQLTVNIYNIPKEEQGYKHDNIQCIDVDYINKSNDTVYIDYNYNHEDIKDVLNRYGIIDLGEKSIYAYDFKLSLLQDVSGYYYVNLTPRNQQLRSYSLKIDNKTNIVEYINNIENTHYINDNNELISFELEQKKKNLEEQLKNLLNK